MELMRALYYREKQILNQKKYHLVANDKLAADHGCLITQALLYLKEKLA